MTGVEEAALRAQAKQEPYVYGNGGYQKRRRRSDSFMVSERKKEKQAAARGLRALSTVRRVVVRNAVSRAPPALGSTTHHRTTDVGADATQPQRHGQWLCRERRLPSLQAQDGHGERGEAGPGSHPLIVDALPYQCTTTSRFTLGLGPRPTPPSTTPSHHIITSRHITSHTNTTACRLCSHTLLR